MLEPGYTYIKEMLKIRPFKIQSECWITEKAIRVTMAYHFLLNILLFGLYESLGSPNSPQTQCH